MANWLLDYIEMTEYIPSELREQLTSIRELDLQVHNAMDELERDMKEFFSRINNLSPKERQEKYDAFLKKCDLASQAAGDKVKVADSLHELVVKSMRYLDQGLEKLKEDLLEGDKAYIVEDLERKSRELEEPMRLTQELLLHQQLEQTSHTSSIYNNELKSNSKGAQKTGNQNHRNTSGSSKSNNSKHNNHIGINSQESNHVYSQATNNHRHSHIAAHHNHTPHSHQNSNHSNTNHRVRNNSTGTLNPTSSVGRQKKRERKRLNSTMTIFNRNSRIDDDSTTSQSFISSPLTPEYLASMQSSSNDLHMNDVAGGNTSALTLQGIIAGNRNSLGSSKDKSGFGNDSLVEARQPILTAIDAAHAVSPSATNSDKLVLFSSNANGDKYNPTQIQSDKHNHRNHNEVSINAHQRQNNGNRLMDTQAISSIGFASDDNTLISSTAATASAAAILKNDCGSNQLHNHCGGEGAFSSLPLSSRHDPIMMAASQAINATQNMTPGRRTSSLKASYAAVNSGRLATAPNHQVFDQSGMGLSSQEVYCKCRGRIQGSNMIACDNNSCKFEWFHYECVGITTPPEGEWFCDDCKASRSGPKGQKQPKLEGLNVI